MLYLDSVILHNFKSFKHASVKFSKGFNCIVGPNGSGKSVICDSLLFALGESSLKRMRVSSLSGLIHNASRPSQAEGGKRAYVKLTLSGDSPLEIMRVIKSNNKVGYRMNGKRATRQAVLDALRASRSELNETNTIAQGEIVRMLSLNAKETRGLIDVAAGIREFDDKKAASLKELEKVETRITEADIMLNERQGFLDELEKEKDDAEKYAKMTAETKSANYTLLKAREDAVSSEYDKASTSLVSVEKRKAETSAKLKGLDLDIEKLSAEREKISKALNERSIELGSTNRLLEDASKSIAIAESQLKSLLEKRADAESHSAHLDSERSEINVQTSKKEEALGRLRVELEELAKAIESKGEPGYDAAGDDALDRMSDNQKRFAALEAELASISEAYTKQTVSLGEANKEIELSSSRLSSLTAQIAERSKAQSSSSPTKASASRKLDAAHSSTQRAIEEIAAARRRIDEIYTESVNIREQLALSGTSSPKGDELIRKHIGSGFHGRAYELCSYEDKHALAVQAAASSRLNYIIVDSVDDADSAISVMKSKGLGRASFIPLDEISQQADAAANDARHMLNFVKYDDKYSKAFSYIFHNTLLVKDIAEAKSVGIRRHRYVTIDGELVEQSGVVTGGAMRKSVSPLALASRLRALESEKSKLSAALSGAEAAAERSRKEMAALQAEIAEADSEAKRLSSELSSLSSERDALSAKASAATARSAEAQESLKGLSLKRDQLSKLMQSIREDNERIYSSANSDQSRTARQRVAKSDLEELKSLRSKAESTKITIATLSKECEMLQARKGTISKELDAIRNSISAMTQQESEHKSQIAAETKHRASLQEKMKSHDTESSGLYKRMQEYEAKVASMSMEKGKAMGEYDKLSRESIELGMTRAQLQTRANDIRAELMSYQGVPLSEERDPKRLESRVAVLKSEIEKLGAVNLKAPEIYEQKKGDVDAARQKLSTLNNEKSAIISMINEIESKKLNIFNETLASVNENFKKLYGHIFDGSAYLYLQNPKDPFNTGLHINIAAGKGAARSSEQLSGGEKSLMMLMLIFAIQMRNAMSFYIFDEIDSALDKENSKKLSKLIKELSRRSQMVVVSHNDSMITAADAAIGVAHRSGESQAVGIKMSTAPEQQGGR